MREKWKMNNVQMASVSANNFYLNCFRVNIKYKIRQRLFYFALTFIYILSQRSERIKDSFQIFFSFQFVLETFS
jgi:hypothetical protein